VTDEPGVVPTLVPDPEPEPEPVPDPDPDRYDAPRAVQARARGLKAPYIAGGEDPDIEVTQRRERRYLRWLVAMIIVVVLAGFVLGILANLVGIRGLNGDAIAPFAPAPLTVVADGRHG